MSEYEPSGPYDPLAKLLKAEKALLARGAAGEPVGYDLQEVRNAIGSIVEQRQAQAQRERERYRR